MHLDSEDRWLAMDFGALRLISSPSTAAHFRRPGGRTDCADVLFSYREVTLSGIFSRRGHGRNANSPAPPGRGLCHACFQDNEFGQEGSSMRAPLHRAQLQSVTSKYAYCAQVLEEEMDFFPPLQNRLQSE